MINPRIILTAMLFTPSRNRSIIVLLLSGVDIRHVSPK
ncbi:Uncharacterised protein [Vibrio cholerae]|nr:Uncharacterised protein [Vibrio cholerae]